MIDESAFLDDATNLVLILYSSCVRHALRHGCARTAGIQYPTCDVIEPRYVAGFVASVTIDPECRLQLGRFADTHDIALNNITQHGLAGRVQIVRARAIDVEWSTPIVLLFVDGLHDYEHVLADFRHFAPHVVPGGLIAFHDYFEHCPGVKQCVDQLLLEGACEFVTHRDRLIVCRKRV